MTHDEAIIKVLSAVTMETATTLVQAALGVLGDISDDALDALAVSLGEGLQRVIERAEEGEFAVE